MNCFIFISLLIHFISPSLCTSQSSPQKFEFGLDIGSVGFFSSGKIGFFQKSVEVPIPTLPCKKLTYVQVDIYNKRAKPNVSLNNNNDTKVLIKYKLLQYSKSYYEVFAKYISIPYCETLQGQLYSNN
ncbi:uncharacterized protein LOC123670027 [Melitaea cinxia]|uniref:uncharacterized protein LOC123670027 n=1 Tax=Melitaea cinxia TaxID=113334 RepID=UPI0004EA6B19|nr:uncharacterized protein LOC123670027 [Melitaea cinxia]